MIDAILDWISPALAALGLVVLAAAGITRPRGERCRCPGVHPRLMARLDPRQWLMRGRCWYDLHASPPGEDGLVRCPECGSRFEPGRLYREGRRVRLGRIALLTLFIAGGVFVAQPVRDGSWPGYLPTLALVVAERQGNSAVNPEVGRRVHQGRVDGWSAKILAESLVQDLRDDDVRWNADRASPLLCALWPASREALEKELRGGDMQSRIIAVRLLQYLCDTPSDDLLWASVQDLRDDSRHVGWLSRGNAGRAFEYLIRYAPRAKPLLREAMQSEDRQQRFLAAAITGHAGLIELTDTTVPILTEHLRDNEVSGDLRIAAAALYHLGRTAIPHLKQYTTSEDDQLRECALGIIERLTYPDRPLDQLEHPMPTISENSMDPLADRGVYFLYWPRP